MKRILFILLTLSFVLPLSGQELPWQVDPSKFEYQATATIQVRIDYQNGNTPSGVLAAFKGEEVRGVADPVLVGETVIYFLNLYSNQTRDTLQFKFALKDSDIILTRDTLFLFEQSKIYGSVDYPLLVDFVESFNYPPVWESIPDLILSKGVTSYKMDLTPYVTDFENEQFRVSVSTQGQIIATVNDDYLLELTIPAEYSGTQKFTFLAFTTERPNDIGKTDWFVHIEAEDLAPIALIETHPIELFLGETEALVSLESLFSSPDNQSFNYSVQVPVNENPTLPEWSVSPQNFEYNMNITLKANVFGIQSNSDTLIIAAFSGNQVRGISSPVKVNDSLRYFIVAFSNTTSDTLTFKAWHKTSSKAYESDLNIKFNALQAVGTVDNPMPISFGSFQTSLQNNKLTVSSNFNLSGTDTIRVYATEIGRNPALSTFITFPITIHSIGKPRFKSFSGQVVFDDELFSEVDLDSLIINPDQSTYTIEVETIQADENYEVELTTENLLKVNTGEAFGKIQIKLSVFRNDNTFVGDSLLLQFERKASYLPPSSVTLISPEMDRTISSGAVRFTWSAAKGGTLLPEYILRIQPKGGLVNSIRGIKDTTYVLDAIESLPDSTSYMWWITVSDGKTTVESTSRNQFGINIIVSNENNEKPLATGIVKTYPNPFNPSAMIQFDLSKTQKVQIEVFDMSGKKVQTLFSGLKNSGQHQLQINGSGWSSGIYLIRMNTVDGVFTKKVVLIK